MKTLTKIADMKAAVAKPRAPSKTVGFVPTMGFLHEGHLSLVRECRKSADIVVVSIFVNPLQFGPQEDFKDCPRDLERDARLLEREGVDFLFHPEAEEMYPEGYRTTVEVAGLQDKLCGRSRPGHFKGVSTVVLKLFNIVRPDMAFFGQKDAQQAILLRKMARDLNLDTDVRVLPIVREADGLALSSRNTYLNPEERQAALVLIESLTEATRMFEAGERRATPIIARMKELIGGEPLARIDYVEVVDLEELDPVEAIDREVLVALAVYIGKTRLIDNTILKIRGGKP
ncbi:MAG: pantoate--beta-alanine ligase [Candidatus Aminicenantes bacterium]|nr:pantoate--beta-alanine ligase [Candidatus Aminicenantes bacterium]